MQFTKATKKKAKGRVGLFGPSGSGKTYTALRIAAGLGGKIALIDSERGSASKYADRFDFDVLELPNFTLATYVEAMAAAAAAGYEVLIIDSLTHGWQELLDEVEKLARSKYRGNTWSAWSEGTPKQRKFIDALLNYPGHVLATMRSKTEWVEEKDERTGKTKPVRVGLSPQQGKGIEYEFDLLVELTPDHAATILKDRSGKFQDRMFDKPGEDFGRELLAWLNDGAEAPPHLPPGQDEGATGKRAAMLARIAALEEQLGPEGSSVYPETIGDTKLLEECTDAELAKYGKALAAKLASRKAAA